MEVKTASTRISKHYEIRLILPTRWNLKQFVRDLPLLSLQYFRLKLASRNPFHEIQFWEPFAMCPSACRNKLLHEFGSDDTHSLTAKWLPFSCCCTKIQLDQRAHRMLWTSTKKARFLEYKRDIGNARKEHLENEIRAKIVRQLDNAIDDNESVNIKECLLQHIGYKIFINDLFRSRTNQHFKRTTAIGIDNEVLKEFHGSFFVFNIHQNMG